MIEFKNVSKIYSTGLEAVKDANFTIDKDNLIEEQFSSEPSSV